MSELDLYKPVAEAISLLLYPHAEVVIHDLKKGCIQAIFNNLSKRKKGDESSLDENDQLPGSKDVFPPYFKMNWDGRRMKAVSAVLRSRAGTPIGLLCINLDISKWEKMQQFIQELITSNIEKPEFLFKNDWREQINIFVTSYLQRKGLCLESLERNEKRELLMELWNEGAFKTKNAATYVADVLQISRATVYNYLKERA